MLLIYVPILLEGPGRPNSGAVGPVHGEAPHEAQVHTQAAMPELKGFTLSQLGHSQTRFLVRSRTTSSLSEGFRCLHSRNSDLPDEVCVVGGDNKADFASLQLVGCLGV